MQHLHIYLQLLCHHPKDRKWKVLSTGKSCTHILYVGCNTQSNLHRKCQKKWSSLKMVYYERILFRNKGGLILIQINYSISEIIWKLPKNIDVGKQHEHWDTARHCSCERLEKKVWAYFILFSCLFMCS